MLVMERADPENLTVTDYKRAVRNVEQTKRLIDNGKTPTQFILDIMELISIEEYSNSSDENL